MQNPLKIRLLNCLFLKDIFVLLQQPKRYKHPPWQPPLFTATAQYRFSLKKYVPKQLSFQNF